MTHIISYRHILLGLVWFGLKEKLWIKGDIGPA